MEQYGSGYTGASQTKTYGGSGYDPYVSKSTTAPAKETKPAEPLELKKGGSKKKKDVSSDSSDSSESSGDSSDEEEKKKKKKKT